MVDASAEVLHLVDIALMGDMRRKGYGTTLIWALKTVATQSDKPLRLMVDQQNEPARKLYFKLGFMLQVSSATAKAGPSNVVLMVYLPTPHRMRPRLASVV